MRCLPFILLAIFCDLATAQQDLSDPYGPGLRFREGIYMNFEAVRNNNPVAKAMIRSDVAYDDADFYQKVLDAKEIQYFDGLGTIKTVPVKNIWGYSRNGFLYIAMEEGFFRINIMGSICHFLASRTVYENYSNPYYSYYYPYNPYYYPYPATASSEIGQYLLDFNTGNVLAYDVSSVEILLMQDPELYDEYMGLRKKKKQQQRFMFIRKFNDKHPIYIQNDMKSF